MIDCRDFPKIGMFAAANQILGQLAIFDTKLPVEIDGLCVDFGSHGLYYDPGRGPNWWSYYFEPLCVGRLEKDGVYPPKFDYIQGFKRRRQLTRQEASELVRKYIKVKRQILEKVEQFVWRHFSGFYVIGVHYRGTDKKNEAPRVPYRSVFEAIAKHIPEESPWRIFAASDEDQFIEAIQRAFPGRVVACDARRSQNGEGVHFMCEEPYLHGEEALTDALLLSKSSILIRTSSNLSLWATYFNSELPTILLSQNYRWRENKELE
jgi:hypothetical protein